MRGIQVPASAGEVDETWMEMTDQHRRVLLVWAHVFGEETVLISSVLNNGTATV